MKIALLVIASYSLAANALLTNPVKQANAAKM